MIGFLWFSWFLWFFYVLFSIVVFYGFFLYVFNLATGGRPFRENLEKPPALEHPCTLKNNCRERAAVRRSFTETVPARVVSSTDRPAVLIDPEGPLCLEAFLF